MFDPLDFAHYTLGKKDKILKTTFPPSSLFPVGRMQMDKARLKPGQKEIHQLVMSSYNTTMYASTALWLYLIRKIKKEDYTQANDDIHYNRYSTLPLCIW
jgi:hypothetical protein